MAVQLVPLDPLVVPLLVPLDPQVVPLVPLVPLVSVPHQMDSCSLPTPLTCQAHF